MENKIENQKESNFGIKKLIILIGFIVFVILVGVAITLILMGNNSSDEDLVSDISMGDISENLETGANISEDLNVDDSIEAEILNEQNENISNDNIEGSENIVSEVLIVDTPIENLVPGGPLHDDSAGDPV